MATSHDCYNNELASVSIEEPLCNYLTAFDGTKKDFNDIRPYFDDLFSDNLIHLMDGHPIGKPSFTRINKNLLEQRLVATLEDIHFVDDMHVEYTVHWSNEYTSMVTHIIAFVADGKIVKMQPCEETKGVFAGMSFGCHSNSSLNPLHQLLRFGGGVKQKRGSTFFEQPLPDGNRSVVEQLSSATLYVSPQKYLSKIGVLVGKAVGSFDGYDERLENEETVDSGDLDREMAGSPPPVPIFPQFTSAEHDTRYS
mmetsp:Transcript_24293/g.43792  ORF Transcript_24293/g.43792 Transcript_24293/m.43792 type:complete len:253 (+) Transcript_24293:45-803(+)|eukprot:CAMPEP_0201621460 /NCGR_PEP_ID=MMETSP0492-20130828/46888_1 /ASSEMBLY_ACC=CAM_ASM_000837 /TAXON_ID=420259 /ORGANISM="Thalassiosira gravida, Strain GMp14c1" /LENGTH=252 /DNA_ID=CAMNT_0048090997 /DNA_START=124 /DNA_END=882 /DNA_ORIENTATION=-